MARPGDPLGPVPSRFPAACEAEHCLAFSADADPYLRDSTYQALETMFDRLEVVSVHFGAAEKACLRIEVVMVPQHAEYSDSWAYTSCKSHSRQVLMIVSWCAASSSMVTHALVWQQILASVEISSGGILFVGRVRQQLFTHPPARSEGCVRSILGSQKCSSCILFSLDLKASRMFTSTLWAKDHTFSLS